MSYLDELLLKKREEKKKEKHSTLEAGVYMNGEIMLFAERELFGKVKVMLPEEWTQMPEEYARVKYPSEFRPKVLITTPNLRINMGFTIFPEKVQAEEAGKITENIRAAIHRSNPDYPMYPCETLKEVPGSWFAFRSHAMDSDVYNMLLMAPVGKELVQGSFNCPYKEYFEWKRVVLMIWNTITKKEMGV